MANTNKTTSGTNGANQEGLISLSTGSQRVHTHTHIRTCANNTTGCSCDRIALESIAVATTSPSTHQTSLLLSLSTDMTIICFLQDGTHSDASATSGPKSQMVSQLWTVILDITLLVQTFQFNPQDKAKWEKMKGRGAFLSASIISSASLKKKITCFQPKIDKFPLLFLSIHLLEKILHMQGPCDWLLLYVWEDSGCVKVLQTHHHHSVYIL